MLVESSLRDEPLRMPYTISCSPAPLTFTIRPRMDWQVLFSMAWLGFVAYVLYNPHSRNVSSDSILDFVFLAVASIGVLLALIRRERVEVYPDRMIWSKTYFGFTRSKSAPLSEVLAVEWSEGQQHGNKGKGPDYVEFYLTNGSVKACFGFTFEEFDRMREEVRSMYPDLVKRWGTSRIRSKDLTLLNLS